MSASKRRGPLREDLFKVVKSATGFTVEECDALVSGLLATIVEHVKSHDVTEIRGLGSFRWVRHAERKYTGGLFGNRTIPAYDHLKFKTIALKRRAE